LESNVTASRINVAAARNSVLTISGADVPAAFDSDDELACSYAAASSRACRSRIAA
jgi:hypothetical protein